MDYQEAIEVLNGNEPDINRVVIARAVAVGAMQELQDIKSQMDDNLKIYISELRQAKYDIETFWEEPTALSKALQIAIRALLEIQQYKQFGTPEEVRAAVEKQKAKKPNVCKNPVVDGDNLPICPTCNTIMVRTEIFGRTIDEHCVTCGQAIDWSD